MHVVLLVGTIAHRCNDGLTWGKVSGIHEFDSCRYMIEVSPDKIMSEAASL